MLVVGLVSGGKDSCYNMVQCVAAGHSIVALANLRPSGGELEADSQMFQTVGWSNVQLLAEAMDLPLYVEETAMEARAAGREYSPVEGDEVEDLYRLLARVQEDTGCEGVSVGAILSDYQRVRVESVCLRLGMTPLAFLWRRQQSALLREMVEHKVEAVLVKVACLGLDSSHLGLTLAQAEPGLTRLAGLYGVNVCGEGGEFETFTLDCPLFRRRLVVSDSSVVTHSADAFAPVCLLSLQLELQGEARQGSQAELVGQEVLRALHPDTQAGPEVSIENLAEAPKVEMSRLEVLEDQAVCRDEGEGWFLATGAVGRGGQEGEAVEEAFRCLKEVLREAGAELDMVVKVYMYVDSMDSYAAMNAAYVTHFGTNPPVRVCVGVGAAHLPPGARLVLGAWGHRGGRGTVLHVQGVSHWAPANIGPYSQGVLAGGQLHVSGQIGLVPGSMLLAPGEAAQAGLALRHCSRVAEAMAPGLGWGQVSRATCYVVGEEGARQAEVQWREVGGTGHVTYLQVHQLPRQALVEWEVVYRVAQTQDQESDSS